MAVFLYSFYDKKVISVEENKGVTIFLPFIGEKSVIGVEENAGVAIFLYTFRGNPGFSVEENRGVAIFLPFFDKNVIFAVEENAGVPVFLYSFDQIASERPQCGVGLRPTDGRCGVGLTADGWKMRCPPAAPISWSRGPRFTNAPTAVNPFPLMHWIGC